MSKLDPDERRWSQAQRESEAQRLSMKRALSAEYGFGGSHSRPSPVGAGCTCCPRDEEESLGVILAGDDTASTGRGEDRLGSMPR